MTGRHSETARQAKAREGGPAGTWWRESPADLARLLREHGQDPERVASAEAAWPAFRAFLACPVGGLESGEFGDDADGFIVQWGRYGFILRTDPVTVCGLAWRGG